MFVPAQRNPPVPLGDSLRTVHNAPLPVVSTRPLHSSAAAHTFNEIGVPQPTKAIMPGSLNKFIDRRTSATLLQRSASQVGMFFPMLFFMPRAFLFAVLRARFDAEPVKYLASFSLPNPTCFISNFTMFAITPGIRDTSTSRTAHS